MSSLAELKKLEERYPFTEEELEILLRGHQSILDEANEDSIVIKLALSSPYAFFFLPDDEMRHRAEFVEDTVLPMGFPNAFRAAISADAFVNYANQGEELSLERFLEGVADSGRRGPKEASRVLYEIFDQPTPEEVIDLAFRLSIAADALVKPQFDRKVFTNMLDNADTACGPLVQSLKDACEGKELTKAIFIQWVENTAPMLPATLSTFVHNLLFHGRPYPTSRVPYEHPVLDHVSEIFVNKDAALLFPLSVASFRFNGKMHRLYSTEDDGRSFNRLEWSLLGYTGPSFLVIKTDKDAIIGAFVSSSWKDSVHFQGDSGCFLLQLSPALKTFLPTGKENHFVYCHSESFDGNLPDGHAHGLGFGGAVEKPRLFIPESLEECTAEFSDHTFRQGDILPTDALEKFQIKVMEVWGVGGDEVITNALRDRAEHRERTDTAIMRARKLTDKTQIAKDLHSGLIPNKLFEFGEDVRGRQEFRVDDEHGGYKVDRE